MEDIMHRITVLSLLCCLIASQAVAQTTIAVSCYRGPWKDVIWDRPNPQFIGSLVAAGYSSATASSIATRVCRNPNFVDRPGAMANEVQWILQTVPLDGRVHQHSHW